MYHQQNTGFAELYTKMVRILVSSSTGPPACCFGKSLCQQKGMLRLSHYSMALESCLSNTIPLRYKLLLSIPQLKTKTLSSSLWWCLISARLRRRRANMICILHRLCTLPARIQKDIVWNPNGLRRKRHSAGGRQDQVDQFRQGPGSCSVQSNFQCLLDWIMC